MLKMHAPVETSPQPYEYEFDDFGSVSQNFSFSQATAFNPRHAAQLRRLRQRPRSTPPALKHAVANDNGFISKTRPNTAVGVPRMDCNRVHQLEHEPTRKHTLDSHLPTKRNRKPPWQKQLDATPVPQVIAPGYILAKSKSKVHMYIKTDEFFEKEEDEKLQQMGPERDSLVAQLQQQIDDLTLYLEEERLNHRDTKRIASEHLQDRITEMKNQHENHCKTLEDMHNEKMDEMKKQLEEEMEAFKKQTDEVAAKTRGELEYIQGAFETYKYQLNLETEEKWQKKESELTNKFEEDLNSKVEEIRSRFAAEKNREKSEMSREHLKVVQQMKKDHKKEIESLHRKYSNAADTMKLLQTTEEELKDTKTALEELKIKYDKVCNQLAETMRELTDTRVKLMSYEKHFADKVQEVDDKYRAEIHNLMQSNTDLRNMYMKKCGELIDGKYTADEKTKISLENAKDTMKAAAETEFVEDIPDIENKGTVITEDKGTLLDQNEISPNSEPCIQNESQTSINNEVIKDVGHIKVKRRPKACKPRIVEVTLTENVNDSKLTFIEDEVKK